MKIRGMIKTSHPPKSHQVSLSDQSSHLDCPSVPVVSLCPNKTQIHPLQTNPKFSQLAAEVWLKEPHRDRRSFRSSLLCPGDNLILPYSTTTSFFSRLQQHAATVSLPGDSLTHSSALRNKWLLQKSLKVPPRGCRDTQSTSHLPQQSRAEKEWL